MKRAISMMVLLVCSAVPVYAESWVIDTVDHEGSAGQGTYLYVDTAGVQHILYNGGNSGTTLLLATWTGTGWQKENVSVSSSAFAAAYDSAGVLHYVGASGITTWYRYRDNTGWHSQQISNLYSLTNYALCFDTRHYPHAFFPGGTGSVLLEVRKDTLDGLWKTDTLPTAGEVYYGSSYVSAVINSSNHKFVAYNTTGTNFHLKLAYYDGTSWGLSYIDAADQVGQYCKMVLDPSGVPCVAYYDAKNTRLKYATLTTPPPPVAGNPTESR